MCTSSTPTAIFLSEMSKRQVDRHRNGLPVDPAAVITVSPLGAAGQDGADRALGVRMFPLPVGVLPGRCGAE